MAPAGTRITPARVAVPVLPTLNAALNLTATVLLVSGVVLIRRKRERAHKLCMIAALWVSAAFLTSYLIHHGIHGSTRFWGEGGLRTAYLAVLLSHTVLATLVPFLALRTVWLALKDRRAAHRRWARFTFPIWLYVSITGVVIYVMLYPMAP